MLLDSITWFRKTKYLDEPVYVHRDVYTVDLSLLNTLWRYRNIIGFHPLLTKLGKTQNTSRGFQNQSFEFTLNFTLYI